MYSEFVQKRFLPPHLLDHRLMLLFDLSTHDSSSQDQFVHIVLFFHCVITITMKTLLWQRGTTLDVVMCEMLPSSAQSYEPYKRTWSFSYDPAVMRRHDEHFDTHVSATGLFSSQGQNSRDCCSLKLHNTFCQSPAQCVVCSTVTVVLYFLSGVKHQHGHSQPSWPSPWASATSAQRNKGKTAVWPAQVRRHFKLVACCDVHWCKCFWFCWKFWGTCLGPVICL